MTRDGLPDGRDPGDDGPARFNLLGSTPGQAISRILLVAGLLLMLFVVVMLSRALA